LDILRNSQSIFAESFLQTKAENQDFYQRFKKNQILYDMPHQEILGKSSSFDE